MVGSYTDNLLSIQLKHNLLSPKSSCASNEKNSDYRAHTAPLSSKLEILHIFQVNMLEIAKFMFRCLHSFSIPLQQTVKFIDMIQEQPVIIQCILVVLKTRKSQFSTKEQKSRIVFLYLLQTCQAFLSSGTKC